MKLSVVFPVYNEQGNLLKLHEDTCGTLGSLQSEYEMIFVDDGSTDGSVAEIREICKKDPNAKGVFLRRNFGQTAAMSAGKDLATGDVLFFMDSDLQNDPRDIRRLLDRINEGYDVVSGWRKNRQDPAILRKIPSKVANWLIRKIGGVPIHDLGCSLKAYRMDLIKDVMLYGEMHRFIPVYAHAFGARISEVEVAHHPRAHGVSKYGISRTFRVILDLITVKFMLSYFTRPMHFFGGAAFWLLLACGASGSVMLYNRLMNDIHMIRSPLLLLTAMLFILAINFILMGLLSETQMRTYFESSEKKSYRIRETIGLETRRG